MKVELDFEMMNDEMYIAFEKYLKKYDMSVAKVIENLIFALDRSNRMYDKTQDESYYAETFLHGLLDWECMSHDDYDSLNFKIDDFVYKGELFNKKWKKIFEEIMNEKDKNLKKQEVENSNNIKM